MFVLRLLDLSDAIELPQKHAQKAFSLLDHNYLHRPCLPFPQRSNENPRATKITAERNRVSPTGQKQERDIPKPKQIAYMHLF
jgi:hypothetical protein